jgi:hypothetical protein
MVEKVAPVEVTPDFGIPVPGTPFGPPMEFAERYYRAAVEAGKMPPEIGNRLAIFADMSRDLSRVWKEEQDAAEAERSARHPFKVLEDALVEGTRRQYGALNQEPYRRSIARELPQIFAQLKRQYDQERLVGGNASDAEILDRAMASEGVHTTLDVAMLVEGYPQGSLGNARFPISELPAMLKALGAIPVEAPDAEQFPVKHENRYLKELLEARGATSTKVEIPYGGQHAAATEYTCPTRIPGVDVVVGILDRYADGHEEVGARGFPIHEGFKLQLTKPFLAEALGLQLSEDTGAEPVPAKGNDITHGR